MSPVGPLGGEALPKFMRGRKQSLGVTEGQPQLQQGVRGGGLRRSHQKQAPPPISFNKSSATQTSSQPQKNGSKKNTQNRYFW